MSFNPQLIAPFSTGLIQSVEPWLAPPDALTEVFNFHVHDGYLEKREGYTLYGYMVYNTNNSIGDDEFVISTITQANPGVVTTAALHDLTNGQQVLITGVADMDEVNNQRYTIANVGATSFEIADTSSFSAAGSGGRAKRSPGNPITGIHKHINNLNIPELYIYDTQKVNKYDIDTHVFNDITTNKTPMNGNSSSFVWSAEWLTADIDSNNIIYFSNGIPFDHDSGGVWDGLGKNGLFTINAEVVSSFIPTVSPTGESTRRMIGGKLIFPFFSRLIVLNTYEDDGNSVNVVNYPQRCRFSQLSNPSVGNWREGPGGGGFLDAPTGDHIISARPLKDSIIVFFTQSVWVLKYATGLPDAPFRWYKLNDFRACDGKMASIGYDQGVMSLGRRGITITDYSQTVRIDGKIQDFVTEDVNASAFENVFCGRSYGKQRWWTLYPKQAVSDDDESKGALIFDDDSQAFTKYFLSFNCLGNGNIEFDYGCDEFIAQNGLDLNCQQVGDETCNSSKWQNDADVLLSGDFDGGIYVLENRGSDLGETIEGCFKTTSWAPFKEEGIESQMSFVDIYADSSFYTVGEVRFFKDNDMDPYGSQQVDFLPDLGYISSIEGDIAITQANPAVVTSPQHGRATGDVVYIYLVEGMVEVVNRAFTITVIDSNSFSLDGIDSTSYTEYTGSGIVVEREFYKTRVWKRVYAGGMGYEHSMDITVNSANEELKIHGLKPYFKPRGKRTVN